MSTVRSNKRHAKRSPQRPVRTSNAPAPLGPYAQGVLVEEAVRTLYLAGQLPIDPVSGAIVGCGDIRRQAEQVLDNLAAVLRAAGMSFANLVRVGVYLADPTHFSAINEVYAERIGSSPPARTTICGARFRLDVLLEIDGIAVG